MNSVLILNGPNLGRLGSREPEIYGSLSLADIEAILRADAPEDVALRFEQTDDEATLMGFLHEALDARMGVILNPAAFTHYSYAIRDACAMVTGAGLPLIEVHLSNIHRRESFRHHSYVAGAVTGSICGLGSHGYLLALDALAKIIDRTHA